MPNAAALWIGASGWPSATTLGAVATTCPVGCRYHLARATSHDPVKIGENRDIVIVSARRVLFGFATVVLVGVAKVYVLTVRGALILDLGIGRRVRPLGPIEIKIAADPETVFDIIAAPYLGKTPHAMENKLRVLERGTDMVLAEHFTDVGRGQTAVTVETVRFERPHTINFRLVRGPVPHVTETFDIQPDDGGTAFTYTGEMGADFWALGSWWADQVAVKWEKTVEGSVASVKDEAERLAIKIRRPADKTTKAPSKRTAKIVDE